MNGDNLSKIKNAAVRGIGKSAQQAQSAQSSGGSPPAGGSKINVGGASVFSLLIVLCLAVFAVISVMTARRENTLSEKAASAVSNYYDLEMRYDIFYKQLQTLHSTLPLDGIYDAVAAYAETDDPDVDVTVSMYETDGIIAVDYTYTKTGESNESVEAAFEISADGVSVTRHQIVRADASGFDGGLNNEDMPLGGVPPGLPIWDGNV